MDAENIMALYAQLVGVGFLWVTVHCSGMCGPIIAGLVVHTHPLKQGSSAWGYRWSVAKYVLAYQSGRGLMYALLGMLAGLLGAQIEALVQPIAAIASLLVAGALILAGLLRLPAILRLRARLRVTRQAKNASAPKPPISARFVAAITRRLPNTQNLKGATRMFANGFVLGLLPCMLMFWVLGLAASSASPLHGAGLMLTLIVLTTPILVAAGLSTTLISPKLRRLGQHIVPFGMIFSGVWLGLIAMAANGWIQHIHLPFTLWGHKLVFMLW